MDNIINESKVYKFNNFKKKTKRDKPQVIIIPENIVVKNCIEWLWRHGVFCWRNNSGALKPEGSYRPIRFGYPGSSDILGIYNGKLICVECKRSHGGIQQDNQKAFQAKIEEKGGIYILARSIDDLEARREEILA